jgi:hypothetical protein
MHEVVLNEIARCISSSENWWIMSLIFYPYETNNIENSLKMTSQSYYYPA